MDEYDLQIADRECAQGCWPVAQAVAQQYNTLNLQLGRDVRHRAELDLVVNFVQGMINHPFRVMAHASTRPCPR